MTLKQFNKLDEHEQAEVVWDKGVLLADRLSLGFRYLVYQVDSYYVEFRYNIEYNLITGLGAFDDVTELKPYQEQIKQHRTEGKPKATLTELRDKALKALSTETIETIINTSEQELATLHYSLGLQIRNGLDIWHAEVVDDSGKVMHPDDVSQALIKELWHLKN